jgi:hypothetical protein
MCFPLPAGGRWCRPGESSQGGNRTLARLWQNLSRSCDSDLATTLPRATATKGLGNSPSVAPRHCVDPTDEAFERAKIGFPTRPKSTQNPPQQGHAGN